VKVTALAIYTAWYQSIAPDFPLAAWITCTIGAGGKSSWVKLNHGFIAFCGDTHLGKRRVRQFQSFRKGGLRVCHKKDDIFYSISAEL